MPVSVRAWVMASMPVCMGDLAAVVGCHFRVFLLTDIAALIDSVYGIDC